MQNIPTSLNGGFPQSQGFTLAELLISLALLGAIATFTIPKVLVAQQSASNAAKAREAAAIITGAYQKAQQAGVVTSATRASDLTPYINYVSIDTSGTAIDATPFGTFSTCDSTYPCIKLHNGGVLWPEFPSFGGTSALHAIEFRFDPDGANNTTVAGDGPLKAVQFTLYYNGRLSTRGQAAAGTTNTGGAFGLNPGYDPSWYQ